MSKNKNDHGKSGGKDHDDRDDRDSGHKDKGKLLVGTNGDDTLAGGSRNDLIIGRKGDDTLEGGAGNDILIGDGGLGGKGWHWVWGSWWKPKSRDDDYLDGGAGSDLILAGKGDDVANYTLSENKKSHDVYDGGKGFDTLQLTLTYAEFKLASVQKDIAAFEAFLDKKANAKSDDGKTFEFKSFNLDVRNFEALEIVLLNAPPVAKNDAYALKEDSVLLVAGPGVLANDTDADGNALSATLVTGPAHGTLALNGNGSFTYTPTANYHGADSFTYKVNDGELQSGIATVSLTVASVNDAPVAADDAKSTAEDTPVTGTVLANDSDVDGGSLSAVLVQGPAHGSLQLNGNGSYLYTPGANFNGADSFTYRASDGKLSSNIATVSLTVTAVNDAPVALNDEQAGDEDTVLTGNVLANDLDADGDALVATLLQGPAHGTLVLNGDGSFEYTPEADYFGTDSFTYRAGDASVASNEATVALTIHPVNDEPDAGDIVLPGGTGGGDMRVAVIGGASGSYAAAAAQIADSTQFDFDVSALSATAFSSESDWAAALADYDVVVLGGSGGGNDYGDTGLFAALGNFITAGGGVVTTGWFQQAMAGMSGQTLADADAITPLAGAATAWAARLSTITIADPDHSIAGGLTGYTVEALLHELGTATDATATVLATGTAAAGSTLAAIAYDEVGDGRMAYLGSLHFASALYLPESLRSGAADEILERAVAWAAGEQEPGATTTQNNPILISSTLLLDGATDLEGDPIFLSAVSPRSELGAEVSIDGDGNVVYDPTEGLRFLAEGEVRTDTFTYTLSNSDGSFGLFAFAMSSTASGGGTGTVSLTVAGVNDAPDAVSDARTTNEDSAFFGNVLANDSDIDRDALTVTTAGTFITALGAEVTLNANGSYSYDPTVSAQLQALAQGTGVVDSFNYTISDGKLTDSATVDVTVVGLNEPGSGGGVPSKILPQTPAWADLDYYVRFDIQGQPEGEWLQLSGFSLGAQLPVTLGSGGGGGAGKVKMDEVHLTLGSSATVVALTKAIAEGRQVNVEVEAYRQGGDGKEQLVDEYRFDTAFLSGLTTVGSPGATAEEVSFNFTKITHTHQEQNTKTGGIGDKATASYDVSTNTTTLNNNGATADAIKELPTGDLPVNASLTYYMTYAGAPGWLELDAFQVNLENSTSIGSGSGGAGAGKVKMGDVHLALGSSKQLVELMAGMTQGKHLEFLEVEAYRTASTGKPQLVDEYYFDTVFLSSLDTSGSANLLGIEAGKFAHGHVETNSKTGAPGDSFVQGWDFLSNTAWNNGAPDADFGGKNLPLPQTPAWADLDYYVRFDIQGQPEGEWLQLSGFSLGAQLPVTLGSGGGGGAGKVKMDEVHLTLGSSATVVALTKAIAEGRQVNVEVEAYRQGGDGKEQLVDEYRFDTAFLSGLTTVGSPGATAEEVSFNFTKITHTHQEQNTKTGGIGDKATASYDVSTNTTTLNNNGATADAIKELPTGDLPVNASLTYYMTYAGAPGWLELDAFQVNLENSTSIGSGSGGAGAGKVKMGDVHLALGSSKQLVELMAGMTQGKHLEFLEVEAYRTASTGKPQLVDEYYFDTVFLSSLDTSGSANLLGIEAGKFAHGHVETNSKTGAPGDSFVQGWDFLSNTAWNNGAPDADFGGKNLPLPQTPAWADLDYYVRFDIQGQPEGEWLQLSGFSLGAQLPVTLGSGGGGGAGKVKMDEVHLTLGSSATVVALTKAIAEGRQVNVEVEAYRQGGDGKEQLVDEYRFDTAFLSGLTTVGSPGATAEEVSFNFTKITHTHQEQNTKTGGIGDKATASYDVSTNTTTLNNNGATADAIKELPTGDLPVNASLTYYMTYAGAPGWLELDAFQVNLENSTSIGSGSGGAGAGKVKMGDVHLALGSSKQLVELMAGMTQGKHLEFLEVEAYRTASTGKPQLVDEYYFDTVFLSSLDTSGSANLLGIEAGKFAHGHVETNSKTGAPGDSFVQGWDFLSNTAWNNGAPDSDLF